MNYLRVIIAILCCTVGSQIFASQELVEKPKAIEIVEKIGAENLSKVTGEDKPDLKERLKASAESGERSLAVLPYSQELIYVDGYLCHVGYYADFFVITFLEGYQKGLQSSVDYYGYVFLVNYNYTLHYDYLGVTFQHDYWGYSIFTDYNSTLFYIDYNQEIIFY